jgi:hypothetical protein
MFDFIKNLFKNNLPEPKVGDILINKTWGALTKIEVIEVSKDKKEIMYKFITVKGLKANSGSTYTGSWKYLLMDTYDLVEK